MSNVTLQIGGRSYTVACQDGQEAHIGKLGQAIDAKLQTMGNLGQNEARTLLFAALLLADEADELRNKPGGAAPAPAPAPAAAEPSVAPALEALAGRLEKLAASLES